MVVVKRYCTAFTYIFTTVSKTASAGVCNNVTGRRTFITSDAYNLYHVWIFFISAHGKFYTFAQDSTLFIYAATHCRSLSRNNHLRYVHQIFKKCIIPSLFCNLS